jgi:RNA polymerase-binding transcription factor DksA
MSKVPADDHEKITDESDRATEVEMHFTADSIEEVRRRCTREQEPSEDGRYPVVDCVRCGEPIGLGRLKAAIQNTICIDCARLAEKSTRRF